MLTHSQILFHFFLNSFICASLCIHYPTYSLDILRFLFHVVVAIGAGSPLIIGFGSFLAGVSFIILSLASQSFLAVFNIGSLAVCLRYVLLLIIFGIDVALGFRVFGSNLLIFSLLIYLNLTFLVHVFDFVLTTLEILVNLYHLVL